MITREQEQRIEFMSVTAGGQPLAVRHGYEDGVVEVIQRNGRSWRVDENGLFVGEGIDFGIDWSEF